jgi:hypothetical protein
MPASAAACYSRCSSTLPPFSSTATVQTLLAPPKLRLVCSVGRWTGGLGDRGGPLVAGPNAVWPLCATRMDSLSSGGPTHTVLWVPWEDAHADGRAAAAAASVLLRAGPSINVSFVVCSPLAAACCTSRGRRATFDAAVHRSPASAAGLSS